jgi:hypothetical protein
MKTKNVVHFDSLIEKEGLCASPIEGKHPTIPLDPKK